MNDQADFLDSHAPFDFDPERNESWPLPAPRKFAPSETKAETKTWRDNLRALVERVGL